MQREQQILLQNAHCKYLTTPLAAPVNTMTLTCPEKAMETITIQKPVYILKLPTACSATSPNFYLPPRYETLTLDVNISLNMANLHMLNILAQDFCILKHLGNNRSDVQLQHLTTIPSIQYKKIINTYSIIPYQLCLLIWIKSQQNILIPSGLCFHP